MTRLTHRQVVALAGEICRSRMAADEDDPDPAERWTGAMHMNRVSMSSRPRPVDRFFACPLHRPVEEALLAEQGLVLDGQSMDAVLSSVASALGQAHEHLARARTMCRAASVAPGPPLSANRVRCSKLESGLALKFDTCLRHRNFPSEYKTGEHR
jgi:hypothetical protein